MVNLYLFSRAIIWNKIISLIQVKPVLFLTLSIDVFFQSFFPYHFLQLFH